MPPQPSPRRIHVGVRMIFKPLLQVVFVDFLEMAAVLRHAFCYLQLALVNPGVLVINICGIEGIKHTDISRAYLLAVLTTVTKIIL